MHLAYPHFWSTPHQHEGMIWTPFWAQKAGLYLRLNISRGEEGAGIGVGEGRGWEPPDG